MKTPAAPGAEPRDYDAIVVGAGPAGATCGASLARAGMRVAVLDRARFPRVKLCAGWLSAGIWDELEISPRSYPYGIWEWKRCHVHLKGRLYTVPARGFFIRRCEFDAFLNERSGADFIEGHSVRSIVREDGSWIVDGAFRAPYLIGAAGTQCPVARALFPAKPLPPVGVQELEFPMEASRVAEARVGEDGEPELLLHDDLRGYSWNVPKSDWLNVGGGTVDPRNAKQSWHRARDFFFACGHLPPEAREPLSRVRGHSYYRFDPVHLRNCTQSGALLVGDSLGLSHPVTAEGILPAVLSARLCAESIVAGDPGGYGKRLEGDPVFRDYALLCSLRGSASSAKKRFRGLGPRLPSLLAGAADRAVAHGFARMFSGRALPGRRALEATQHFAGGLR